MLSRLAVVECEKPKFFCFKVERFQVVVLGTFCFFMSGGSMGVCFLAKCLEIQPWSVEEEKQLREMLQEHRRLNEIAAFFWQIS